LQGYGASRTVPLIVTVGAAPRREQNLASVLGDEPLHQALGIWKILLPAIGATIRLRLREV